MMLFSVATGVDVVVATMLTTVAFSAGIGDCQPYCATSRPFADRLRVAVSVKDIVRLF